MVDTPLRLFSESADAPWAFAVNPIVRMLSGITTGGIILRGDLGVRRSPDAPNTDITGRYTIEAQSLAAGGLHAAFPLSGTSLTATPTLANSAALITNTGISLGTTAGVRFDLERLRVYETGRIDYSEATSSNGELVLGGSGANAGGIAILVALRALNSATVQVFNSDNSKAGTLGANAGGDIVTGGSGTRPGKVILGSDLELPAAGRIVGDLTNATIASRAIFQTTTANSGTLVSAMPLGSGTSAGFVGYNNSTPASATGAAQLHATATAIEVRADSPAASYLPMTFHTSAAEAMRITPGGMVLIGDTTNAFMTVGLTLNQLAADNEILALKSSDVAHGITTTTETDTFGLISKFSAAGGGIDFRGLTSGSTGVRVQGIETTNNTTKSTAGTGAIHLTASLKTGTNQGANGANANLVIVADHGSTRFIVDTEGDIHADSGSATANSGTGYLVYDQFDDAQLVRALDVQRAGPGLTLTEWDRILLYGRADLEAAKIATFNDGPDGDGSIFVNYSALSRLLAGAAWQARVAHEQLKAEVTALRSELHALTAGGSG